MSPAAADRAPARGHDRASAHRGGFRSRRSVRSRCATPRTPDTRAPDIVRKFMQRMTLESSLTLCISRSRRARNHGLRPFQGRQQGDFAFHENISRHGNHEGLIVDESAGHTAGARANRASMSGALALRAMASWSAYDAPAEAQ